MKHEIRSSKTGELRSESDVSCFELRISFVIRISSFVILFSHFLRLFLSLLNRPDVHKCLLRQMVPFAVANFLEAADGFPQRGDFARLAGEYFGHQKRLRQEALDAPGTVDDLLIFFAQLFHAENSDDVLQFTIPLQNTLHPAGDGIVAIAYVLRIENAA